MSHVAEAEAIQTVAGSFHSPQDTPHWSKRAGEFAWPTVLLSLSTVLGYGLSFWAAWTQHIPLWVGACINFVMAYLAFTPLHDACHGAVKGNRDQLSWVETTVGWWSGLILLAPYPAFRLLHLRHHGFTNNPEKDPDYWVARDRWWKAALACLSILPHYVYSYLFKFARNTQKHKTQLTVLLFMLITLPLWAGIGFGKEVGLKVLVLYTLPAWIALAFLAFFFDYLPHHPFDSQERFFDTRIMIFPGFGLLTMNQSYHLVHHLYPRIPFYHYSTYFYEARKMLEEKGCVIDVYHREDDPQKLKTWPLT